MQNFSYVMMLRQRGDQQFKIPQGVHCRTGMLAREDLRTAVNAAKSGDLDLMSESWRLMKARLQALHDLTDWFPSPYEEIYKIDDMLYHLYNLYKKSRK